MAKLYPSSLPRFIALLIFGTLLGWPQSGHAAVPPAVIDAAIAGTPAGQQILQTYILGDGKGAGARQRAIAVIRDLRAHSGAVDPDLLRIAAALAYADATLASDGVQIAKVVVDRDYLPTPGAIAWDFGPANEAPAPGFERISPDDKRITGTGMAVLDEPNNCDACADGITGIQRMVVAVPGTEQFRFTLLTENRGSLTSIQDPFGQHIVVNGVDIAIENTASSGWLNQGVLTTRDTGVALASMASRPPLTQTGGIVFEPMPLDGQVVIEFRDHANGVDGATIPARNSFLTALLARPASSPPDLKLLDDAQLNDELASMLNDVATAAGQPPVPGLPAIQDLADNPDVASPN